MIRNFVSTGKQLLQSPPTFFEVGRFVSALGWRTSLPAWNTAGNPPLFSPLLTGHLRRGAVVLSLTLLVAHAAVLQFMANTPRVSVVSNVIQLAAALLAALAFAVAGARAR
ncbi:MAG: hypothetical protein ACRD3I_10345, partial [Terriglobales bacterium]